MRKISYASERVLWRFDEALAVGGFGFEAGRERATRCFALDEAEPLRGMRRPPIYAPTPPYSVVGGSRGTEAIARDRVLFTVPGLRSSRCVAASSCRLMLVGIVALKVRNGQESADSAVLPEKRIDCRP